MDPFIFVDYKLPTNSPEDEEGGFNAPWPCRVESSASISILCKVSFSEDLLCETNHQSDLNPDVAGKKG
jgi:hypothetical protein